MTANDRGGYEVTASSEAVARFDRAVGTQLRFGDDLVDAWEATVTDEPEFVLGQVGRAYLRCLSSEQRDAASARRILAGVDDRAAVTDRERRHLAAARAYAAGDLDGARSRLAALSVEYPRDALALFVGHQLDFFTGDAKNLRDRLGRALPAWDPNVEWYGFVLGMHAFGLEECGQYLEAERAAMTALDHDSRNVWALHAAVHVHEMEGRVEAGLVLMDERRPQWSSGNLFVTHNSWHEALFLLEVDDIAGVLAIHDAAMHRALGPKFAVELLDAAALLWRLHLDGVDVGGRWDALADDWATIAAPPWYVFNDAHAVMAFVGAGRLDEGRAIVDRLEAYVVDSPDEPVANVAMTAEVGLPVCRALVAFGDGRYGDVVGELHPIRDRVHQFGGSHAQRDVVERTLLEAAIRDGEDALARALVAERLAVRESSRYAKRQLARITS